MRAVSRESIPAAPYVAAVDVAKRLQSILKLADVAPHDIGLVVGGEEASQCALVTNFIALGCNEDEIAEIITVDVLVIGGRWMVQDGLR